jgi:uncharacterized RDD family membrane protein YckC
MQPSKSEHIKQANDIISIHFKDELEDFEFKPITKGLGLQKPKITEPTTHRKARAQAATKESIKQDPKQKPLATAVHSTANTSVKLDTQIANFYTSIQNQPNTKNSSSQATESAQQIELANKVDRAAAWLLDVAIICVFLLVVVFCFSLFSGINIDSIIGSVGTINSVIFFTTIFSIFYIFYFTVLDSTETVGKNLFRLKILSSGRPITITASLSRSILTLLSFYLLGIPLYFDLQSKLTNSTVFKDV